MGGTVVARTREEVEKALETGKADEVVVEGDEELLRFAELWVDEKREHVQPEAKPWVPTWPPQVPWEDKYVHHEHAEMNARRPRPIWIVLAAGAIAMLVVITAMAFQPVTVLGSFIERWGGTLIWAIVALVAIMVIYLMVGQAMNTGHKVELSWRVSAVGSGKLVIVKNQPVRKKRRRPSY
jgi:hypothetical protein